MTHNRFIKSIVSILCVVLLAVAVLMTAGCSGNQPNESAIDIPPAEARMDRIADDLSLEGMSPTLFLPTFAGFRQGPGFANLSCLGELSDRVLAGLGIRPASPTSTVPSPERITL